MKKQFIHLLFIFILVIFTPCISQAANIYFETTKENIRVGDTFIINVKIDSDKININSVDGKLIFEPNDNNIVVKDFNLANSIFKIWLQKPVLMEDNKTISFIGGIPGGFIQDNVGLFNIIVEAKKEGTIVIKPKNMTIFANDGKGTIVPSTFKDINVKVSPKDETKNSLNEWNDVVSTDKTSPENFVIEIGRDNSIFEGKRFAFFNAIDNQSGISYYEISENGGPFAKTPNMYVLQNQDEKISPVLSVIAYDKAGNKTTSVYNKEIDKNVFSFSLIIILILIIITTIVLVFKKIHKNK